jgi:23S rRNA (adenine2503-C2)-methyltransferase
MIDLYELDYEALNSQVVEWGGSRTEARALWVALYRQAVVSFGQLEGLSSHLMDRLAAETAWPVPELLASQESPDGETRKDLLRFVGGSQVEVVLLRYRERCSACISTQVGCGCGCVFCATGQMGFVRQLTAGEIVAQVLHVQRELLAEGRQLCNFVLMGMGEPLLNYRPTLAAVRRLVDQRGWAFPHRRITLSTVGIPAGIERLSQEQLGIKLAISLHAATDALRNELVPVNRRYSLDALFEAVRTYVGATGRRVMFEWLMIDGVNDTPGQASALVERLGDLPAHVNLIRLNPTPGYSGRPSNLEAAEAFTAVLDRAGIPHTMRQRRGGPIVAGCGQLYSRPGKWRERTRRNGDPCRI